MGCTNAWAEIYKWVDAKGGTVYSNVAPVKTSSVKNLEVVVEDQKIPKQTLRPLLRAESRSCCAARRLEPADPPRSSCSLRAAAAAASASEIFWSSTTTSRFFTLLVLTGATLE